MRTVLLWGRAWWFGDSAQPLQFADLAHAAEALAAHWAGARHSVRLVYQPDNLATVPVACPHGSRATLADALGGEHPALANSNTAWSHEPILPAQERFATLLHYETEPALFTLVHALGAHGISVESVWPLATWLNALPQDVSDNGAITVCAVSDERAAVYRHGTDGLRGFFAWHGEQALAELGAYLKKVFDQNAGESVLLVPTADHALTRLDAIAHLADRTGVQALPLREALAQTVAFPRKHPARMLSPAPRFTANRLALVASIAFLASAGGVLESYVHDALALRAQGATRAEQKQILRKEIAGLRANEAEIARLRAAVQDATNHGPPWDAALRQLSQSLPPEITLTALHLSPDGFAVQGFITPGTPKAWGDWLTRLGATETLWRVARTEAPDATGRFVVTGKLGT